MPATLPWPKIANTPPNSGSPSSSPSTAQRREIADERLRHRRVGRCRVMRRISARAAPRVDQRLEIGADRADQRRDRRSRRRATASTAAGTPCGRRRSRGTQRFAARRAKPFASVSTRRIEPEQHHAAAMRIALGDQRVDRRPLRRVHRLELPPFGIDARGCRAASSRGSTVSGSRGIDFGGMISSSSSWPLACTAS